MIQGFELNGSCVRQLCCLHHVLDGGAPADWHIDCVIAYKDNILAAAKGNHAQKPTIIIHTKS